MFSKALFKQSCKANGLMWGIITFAVCFMLACVMVISGSGNISLMKNSLEDTIIVGEIDAAIENRAITNYKVTVDGLGQFDNYFSDNINGISSFKFQNVDWFNNPTQELPETENLLQQSYLNAFSQWKNSQPKKDGLTEEEYQIAYIAWQKQEPTATVAYALAISQLGDYVFEKAQALDETITIESSVYKEMLATVLSSINPSNMFDEYYTSHNESIPEDYDVLSLITNISNPDYLNSEVRREYINKRAENSAPIFLAHNMTLEENVNVMLEALSSYGISKEKYASFNYDYPSLKHSATTTILTYLTRFEYELSLIDASSFTSLEEYNLAVQEMDKNLTGDLSSSLLQTLPETVASGLQELGQMDLYSLIVGSIFFKMAGLLLPIIFMIMASNNLIAGQVDSGSMAYVLSTSTKRKQVVFTQAMYLIISLFTMFCCTTLTSVICFACLKTEVELTYSKLVLLNLGAFISLFAMSGICFMASCWFDRSKKSMSIGGGLSMFFLVATMLGLFGSKVIPSVVRLDALNYFNYVTIISLFDCTGIISGSLSFIWKLAILLVIGIVGYVAGAIKFKKKDLPL